MRIIKDKNEEYCVFNEYDVGIVLDLVGSPSCPLQHSIKNRIPKYTGEFFGRNVDKIIDLLNTFNKEMKGQLPNIPTHKNYKAAYLVPFSSKIKFAVGLFNELVVHERGFPPVSEKVMTITYAVIDESVTLEEIDELIDFMEKYFMSYVYQWS